MSRNKSTLMKSRLGKAAKANRRIPLFVMAKTARHVTQNLRKRHWRSKKLKLKERNFEVCRTSGSGNDVYHVRQKAMRSKKPKLK